MPTLPNKREKTAIRQTNEDPTFDILHRHLDDPNKYESRKFMKTVENNAILTILKSKQQRTRVKLKRRILNFEGKNECQRYFRRSWHSTWSFGCFPNEFESRRDLKSKQKFSVKLRRWKLWKIDVHQKYMTVERLHTAPDKSIMLWILSEYGSAQFTPW